jgi:mechanosensitive ion channel-like protein
MDINAFFSAIFSPIKEMVYLLSAYLPNLLIGLLVLIVGSWLAKIIKSLLLSILKFLRIDDIAETFGLDKVLEQGQVSGSLTGLIVNISYQIIMLGVLYSSFIALNLIGLDYSSSLKLTVLGKVFVWFLDFMPRLMIAVFIIIAGSSIAVFVAKLVRLISSFFDFSNDDLLAGFARYTINIYAIIIGLQHLRIGLDIINNVLVVALVAAGLAVALGTKDLIGDKVKALLSAKPKAAAKAKPARKRK